MWLENLRVLVLRVRVYTSLCLKFFERVRASFNIFEYYSRRVWFEFESKLDNNTTFNLVYLRDRWYSATGTVVERCQQTWTDEFVRCWDDKVPAAPGFEPGASTRVRSKPSSEPDIDFRLVTFGGMTADSSPWPAFSRQICAASAETNRNKIQLKSFKITLY